jgi:hypothetical protein
MPYLPTETSTNKFLTHKTTCASEMLEKTTCRKICQKRPPTGGGTSGQTTRGTCRLGRRRHGGAATKNAGMWPGLWRCRKAFAHVGPAATHVAGKVTWHMPPHPSPAPCHLCTTDSRTSMQKRSALTSMQKERSWFACPGGRFVCCCVTGIRSSMKN